MIATRRRVDFRPTCRTSLTLSGDCERFCIAVHLITFVFRCTTIFEPLISTGYSPLFNVVTVEYHRL